MIVATSLLLQGLRVPVGPNMFSVKQTRLALLRNGSAFDLPADEPVHRESYGRSKSYDYQGKPCMFAERC